MDNSPGEWSSSVLQEAPNEITTNLWGHMAEPRQRGAAGPHGLHNYVVQRLGLLIGTGKVPVGSQISPDEVVAELGASRNVVREAIRVLEAKGMVAARPRTGTRVQPIEAWDLLDADVIAWRVRGPDQRRQLKELIDLRSAVESAAVASCCEHASPSEIAELLRTCDRMNVAVQARDLAAFTDADIAFHTSVLLASGNRVFGRFTTVISAILRSREELALMPEHVGKVAVANHRLIVLAVEAKEVEKAEALTRRLIDEASEELFSELGNRPQRGEVRNGPSNRRSERS